jgi:hypothetical protein
MESTISIQEMKARIFGLEMVDPRERHKKQIINDMPLMITRDGRLLCIPKTEEVKIIGITGMTGSCKSVCMNMLLSFHYWHLKRACLVLNDMQKETFEWSSPTDTQTYIHKKLNLKPCPTPLVYIFPSTQTLRLDDLDIKYPFTKMTLPIEEVINNISDYYELDKSAVYLGNLIGELVKCSSISEIKEVLDTNIPEKHFMMKHKLINIFEAIFNNKMLNVSVPDAPAFLEYQDNHGEKYYNNLIQTLLRADFVPSIQTWDLRNQDYFSAYMSYVVNTLYNNQYEDPHFKRRIVSLFVDEIDKLWQGAKGDLIKKSLNIIATNGRAARIGLVWSTQHYDRVTSQISSNTKYMIVGRKKDAKEVAEIKRDFNIPSQIEKEILTLKSNPTDGIFEVACLTTEKFVSYDLDTGKKEFTSEPALGFLVNPLAKHMKPKFR